MSRPRKCRRVEFLPNVTYFKPAGIPLRDLEEVSMSIEEVEAIRLKDLEGLEQEQGAEKMNISRPTFQRVLASARQKIADALLNGKAIRIEGGNFEMTWRRFRCHKGHEWEMETPVSALPHLCPKCNEPDIEPVLPAGFGLNSKERGYLGGRGTVKASDRVLK
ncbi:MAG: DUF134 domain-containing protein [Dehalococcoidales bacterium]